MSFPDTPIRFVASEHIFRHGPVSRLLEWLVAPIPRRKAASGADTVMRVLRALKDGETVCLFAEGDATWDGLTHPVFPATGKLARMAGVPLLTYRLEGGYLSLPRWSRLTRRGKIRGGQVGFYTPEELKQKKGPEITALIDRDLYEDAFARQKTEHVAYRGRGRAEGIERGFFYCPACGGWGTVRGVGDRVTCPCGLKLLYTEEGFFDPPVPVESLAEWEELQRRALEALCARAEGPLFSDAGLRLVRIEQGHREKPLGNGTLTLEPGALEIAGRRFPLAQIDSMAMVKADILLFSMGDDYYEIRSAGDCCLRKYLMVWQDADRKPGE
jgi:1-acyl-sn-glycerol-3-phosphate acyltransferase